jgi:methylmalonyl-CoA mutase N-terminal domain/subunit
LALPTAESAKLALRTQQILAYESGVANSADPLAGSYAVEALTLDIERGARELIAKIEKLGGAIAAIETGFVQNEIGDAAYKAQRAIEQKSAVVVGVNDFVEAEQQSLPITIIDERVEREQVERLETFRAARKGNWQGALRSLDEAAKSSRNLMPVIVDAVRNDCTVGEIVSTLKKTFGEHRDMSG